MSELNLYLQNLFLSHKITNHGTDFIAIYLFQFLFSFYTIKLKNGIKK